MEGVQRLAGRSIPCVVSAIGVRCKESVRQDRAGRSLAPIP